MKYTTIRIEGSILSSDILDKLEQGAEETACSHSKKEDQVCTSG